MTSTGLFRGRRVADPVPIQRGSLTRETRNRTSLNDLAAAWENVDEVRTALQAAEARIQEASFDLVSTAEDQEKHHEPVMREVFSENQRLGRVSRYELRPTINRRDYSQNGQNSSLSSSSHSSIDIPLYRKMDLSQNSHASPIQNSKHSVRQHSPPTRERDLKTTSLPYINDTEDILNASIGDHPRFSRNRESSRVQDRPVSSDLAASNFEDSLEMSTSLNRKRLDGVRPLSSLGLKPVVANNSEALARLKERIKQQKQKTSPNTSALSKPTYLENGYIAKPSEEDISKNKDVGFSPKPLSKRKVAAGPALTRYKGFSEPVEAAVPYKVSRDRESRGQSRNGNKKPTRPHKPNQSTVTGSKVNRGGVTIQRITAPRRPTNVITTTSWRSGQETVRKVLGPSNIRPKSTASSRPQSIASQDTITTSSKLENLEWKNEKKEKTEKPSLQERDMEVKIELNGIGRKEDERKSEDDIKEVDELSQHTLDLDDDDGNDDHDHDAKLNDMKNSRVLSKEAKNILSDLDMDSDKSDDENQPDTVRDNVGQSNNAKETKTKAKKGPPHKMSPGKKRKAPSSQSRQETMYPKAKVRHYDADKVKKYMEKQIAERKKKMKEEKQMQRKAQDERKKRLEELYNKQKKTLAANLAKNKNRMGETYSAKFSGLVNPLNPSLQHPHFHPFTEYPVEDVMTSESDKENVDIASFTSLPIHQEPSSDMNRTKRQQQDHKAYHSYSSSELSMELSDKDQEKNYDISLDKEESEDEADVTLTPVHDESTVREKTEKKREPLYPGFPSEYKDSEKAAVSQPSESTEYKMVAQDKPQAPTTTSSSSPSRSERIAAIRNTAAALKQRLEQEAKRLGMSLMNTAETEQRPSTSGVSKMETEVFKGQLPGVDNLYEQAELNEEMERMSTAATKIQAVYRGHSTRQGLTWKLPSGRTLGATLREAWRGPSTDGGEQLSEHSSISSAMDASSESNGSDVETAYSHDSQSSPKSQSLKHASTESKSYAAPHSLSVKDKPASRKEYRPSTTLGKSWTKPYGDRLSVINIYARNHPGVRHDQEKELPPEDKEAGDNTASLYSDINVDKTGDTASLLEDIEDLKDDAKDLDKTLVGETPIEDNHGYEDDFSLESQDYTKKHSPSPERSYTHSISSPSRTRSPVLSQSDSDYSPTRPIFKSTMRPSESEGSTHPVQPTVRHPPALYVPDHQGGDRMSPGSLDQRLMAELNRLEFMEESVRQLTDIERTKSVSFAQQETVSLAQILKAKQAAHAREMEALQLKAKREKLEAARQLDEARHAATSSSIEAQQAIAKAKTEAADSIAHSTERLVKAQADAARTTTEAAHNVEEARTEAARTLLEATNQQIADVGKITASAASAAAQAAVLSTLEKYKQEQRSLRKQGSSRRTPDSHTRDNYSRDSYSRNSYSERSPSYSRSRSSRTAIEGETGTNRGPVGDGYTSEEFESFKESERSKSARSVSPDRSGSRGYVKKSNGSQPSSVSPTRERSGAHSSASIPEEVDLSVTEGSLASDVIPDEDSVAEVLSEGKKAKENTDHEYSLTFEESMMSSRTVTDDELDYRMILPSEDHRRRSLGKSHRRGSIGSDIGTISYSSDENHDSHLSDSMHEKNAPFSGEDSFSKFTSDMVKLMKEEEVRAKHQEALLQLREKALKEKTKAEMAWLDLQKKRLRDKGSDDVMPSIRKRQRGVLMRLQAEKAEIKRLKAANRAASYERKLLLMQQEEIARLRRSTHKIRGKVREEEAVMSRDKEKSAEEASEDLSKSKTKDSATPGESPSKTTTVPEELSAIQSAAESSFPTHDDQEYIASERARKRSLSEGESDDGVASGSVAAKSKCSPTSSDSFVMQQLKKLRSQSSERYLTQREQKLMRRRDEAEDLLASQRKLIEWERRLDEEENKVCNLINEALNLSRNRGQKAKRPKTLDIGSKAKIESKSYTPTPSSSSASPSKSEQSSSRQPSDYIKFPTGPQAKPERSASESSIAEDISIMAPDRSRDSSIPEIDTKSKDTSAAADYTNDTFESIDSTATPAHSTPLRIETSPKTPSIKSVSRRSSRYDENRSEEDTSMTEASDHSDVECRVRQLKEQLEQRKREAKRLYHERKRQRRAMLLQQEQSLRKELQAVERVIQKTKAELDEPTPTVPQATQQVIPTSTASSIAVEHDLKTTGIPEQKVPSEDDYIPSGETSSLSSRKEEQTKEKTPSVVDVYSEDKESAPVPAPAERTDSSEGFLKGFNVVLDLDQKDHDALDDKSLAKTISDVKDLDISDRSASVAEDLSNHTSRSFSEEIQDDAKTAEDVSGSEASEIRTISDKSDFRSLVEAKSISRGSEKSAVVSYSGSVPEELSARSGEKIPEERLKASEEGYSDTFESERNDKDEQTEEDISEKISFEEEEVNSRDAISEHIEDSEVKDEFSEKKDAKSGLLRLKSKESENFAEEESGSEGTVTEDIAAEIPDDSRDVPEEILEDSKETLDNNLNLAVLPAGTSPLPSYSEDFEPSVGEKEIDKDQFLLEDIAEASETQKPETGGALAIEEKSLKSTNIYSPDFEASSSTDGKDELPLGKDTQGDATPKEEKSQEVPKESHDVPQKSQEVPKESYEVPQKSQEAPKKSQEVPKESHEVSKLHVSEATDEESVAEDLPEKDLSLESGSLSDASEEVTPRFFATEELKSVVMGEKIIKEKDNKQDEEQKELYNIQAEKISNELSDMLVDDALTHVTNLYEKHRPKVPFVGIPVEERRPEIAVGDKERIKSKDQDVGKVSLDGIKKDDLWPEETGEISEADEVSISERLSFSYDEASTPDLNLKLTTPAIDTSKDEIHTAPGGQEGVKPVVDKQVQSEAVISQLSEDLLKEAASQMITLMRRKQAKVKAMEEKEKKEKDEREIPEETVHSPEVSPERGLDKFMAVHRFPDGVLKQYSPPGSPTKDTTAFDGNELADKLSQLKKLHDELGEQLGDDEDEDEDDDNDFVVSNKPLELPSDKDSYEPPRGQSIPMIVPHDCSEVKTMVIQSLATFYNRKKAGRSLGNVTPPAEFSESNVDDNDTDRKIQQVYRRQIFDLTGEVFRDVMNEESPPSRPSWMKPRRRRKNRFYHSLSPMMQEHEYLPVVQKRVIDLVGLGNERPSLETLRRKTPLKTGKKDSVDAILIEELREEEPQWIDYDDDELAVKFQVADAIFDSLLSETVMVMNAVQQRKDSRRDVGS